MVEHLHRDAWRLRRLLDTAGEGGGVLTGGVLQGPGCDGHPGGCCSQTLDLEGLCDALIDLVGPCPGPGANGPGISCPVCGRDECPKADRVGGDGD